MSASWAIGLIMGGPIGSAFSEHTTWRWAFFLNLPCVGAATILAYFCVPGKTILADEEGAVRQRWWQFDWVPILLNIAVPVLFALALTFSGSVWHWGSRPVLGIWLSLGLALLTWALYLWLTVEWRGLLVGARARLSMWALWTGSVCAGASYAICLYYLPLYFAFAKGADALEQTLWVLPFVFAFIGSVAVTGRLLRLPGFYRVIYASGGAVVLATALALAMLLRLETSRAHVAGLEAFMGVGVGLLFQHSIGICSGIQKSKNRRTRLESVFMCNFAQVGGIPVTLAAAASIFQNVGYELLVNSLGQTLREEEIRELLAGTLAKSQNRALLQKGADIVSRVIAREFYIVAAAGSVSLGAGLVFFTCMRHENIEFQNPVEVRESVGVAESSG